MDKASIPASIIELEHWMKENCFNFNNYSINGNAIFEGYGIDKSNGTFSWYYTERGQKDNLKLFSTEADIIEYAFHQIIEDKWAKTHCIGFTTNREESVELQNILNEMGIRFLQDKIPYYEPDKPAYRTFVLGCDIHRTGHLREQYYIVK